MERQPLFHLALASEWSEAKSAGAYERSTLGRSLADQGFIHCSYRHQVQAVADFHYSGRPDVVLLRIDADKITATIRVENLDGGDELFPHIYGPLPVEAVVSVEPIALDGAGRLLLSERED